MHVSSLSVPQPFMSVGRHRWRSSRESPTLSLLGSSGMDRTVCSFDIHVRWQPSLSFGAQFQSAAAFQCTQKNGEEAVVTDYQRVVFFLLIPQTPSLYPTLLYPASTVFLLYFIYLVINQCIFSFVHLCIFWLTYFSQSSLYWSSPDIILCGWLGLKHQLTN